MASAEKAAAVERAKKLLRLAESPNPHEAASAKASAQALIDRFQLSPEDLSGDTLEIVDERGDRYREELSRIVAIAASCHALTSHRGSLAFRGKRSATQLASNIYHALLGEIGRCAFPVYPTMTERETHFACFHLGFISAIANRLLLKQHTPQANSNGNTSSNKKAIIPIAKDVITALDSIALNVEQPDKLFSIRVDAYTSGQSAGYRVELPMIETSSIALPASVEEK